MMGRAESSDSSPRVIGVLHPGAMGSSIGAALVGGGHSPLWASDGRSEATRTRAEQDGLTDAGSLAELVAAADTLISVCPPGEALELATQVSTLGFEGVYVDANAIAPSTARSIGAVVGASGATFVDGGIVGPPARHRGLTVMYLSGNPSTVDTLAGHFAESPLITHDVGPNPGSASAVKVAFAAWTKGTSALLLAVRALAEKEDVGDGLDHAWSILTPELADRLPATVKGTAPKAWRFAAEMREIAAAFEAAGLPGGFHEAAAEIYEAMADLRDHADVEVADVVRRLTID